MDAPPPQFYDFLEFEDPSPYQNQDLGGDNGAIRLNSFEPYTSRQKPVGTAAPATGRDAIPRGDVWGDIGDGFKPAAEQEPLFVDPNLYVSANENNGTRAQIEVNLAAVSGASTRRASSSKSPLHRTSKSSSSSTDITPPEPELPRKRRKKARKDSVTPDEDGKRRKFLERNRIAASKCREKKKQYVLELEETNKALERSHRALQTEVGNLTQEVGALKHRLMSHAHCNDPNIDHWITTQAKRFVQGKNEGFHQSQDANDVSPYSALQHTQVGSAFQVDLPTRSTPSRNPSLASAYAPLQSGVQFDGLMAERRQSIAFSHAGSDSMYASPTDATFPALAPPLKREPEMSYNAMPEPMFSSDQSAFGSG
ncbi:transcription factor atf21 [Staphylotrichum tortipilum]|uniref:Transcription factor atf21 n=1 Tax=Staphylotrichum tortipilum TaxID=2831512 RepID=A0AAN6RRX7_9PEZI|nr:transcription factor atf21 [Staphylotrichum longicolle]